MKKKRRIIIWGIVAAIVIFQLIRSIFFGADKELVFRTHVVGSQTIENSVTATGTIEPVEEVQVGTQVSGEISAIYVDYNTIVKKGQLLAELDKSNLLENLRQAEASVRSAESDMNYAKTSYERTKTLYEAKAATQIAYDEAYNSLVRAETSLLNAKSNLDKAKVNLGYAEIYSPIDGVILSREVEKGQTVAASYSTPTLFTIAKDLTQMKVEADVDEADIGQVKEKQKVRFTVDAYIDDVFEGEVEQIRLKPTTTNNVVKYTVIITAPNPQMKLLPGLTASVTIITEEATGIAIPSEALSFSPSKDVLKMMPKPDEENHEHHNFNSNEEQTPLLESVWVKSGNDMHPQHIISGMSDGIYKIVEYGLKEGDSVILSAEVVSKGKKRRQDASPFAPRGPHRDDGNNANNNGRTTKGGQKAK